jgi:hypothetical protein
VPAPPPEPVGPLEVAGIVICCLCGVLTAIASVALAVVSNVGLPMLAARLGASRPVAAIPFVLWLIVVLALGVSRPEGDVLLPAGRGAQPWVTYGMLLAGALAGGVTIVRQLSVEPTARPGPERQPARGSR